MKSEKVKQDELRFKRNDLLKAFDILKVNVIWGIENITQEQKVIIDDWYVSAKNMEVEAIENPPFLIAKYLNKGGSYEKI